MKLRTGLVGLAVACAAGCGAMRDSWRRKPPDIPPAKSRAAAEARQESVTSGLTVVTVPEEGSPLAAIRVAWQRGSAFDPPERPGLAMLVTSLVLESRTEPGGPLLAHALDDLGAEVQVTAHRALGSIAVLVRRQALARAAELLARSLERFDVDAEAFARTRSRLREQLQASERTPDYLAELALLQATYGEAVAPPRGTSATVAMITLDEARQEHARIAAAPWVVVVAGRVTHDEGLALGRSVFGALERPPPAGVPARLGLPPAAAPRDDAVVFVPLPGLTQVLVAVGRPLETAKPESEVALEAALVARAGMIHTELRHRGGHTYGVEPAREPGGTRTLATISTKVEPDGLGRAMSAARSSSFDVIRGLRNQAYFEAVRDVVARRLHVAHDGLVAATFAQAERIALGRGPDWHEQERRAAMALTPERAEHAVRAHLDPDAWRMVVVGDPRVVLPRLEGRTFVRWSPPAPGDPAATTAR